MPVSIARSIPRRRSFVLAVAVLVSIAVAWAFGRPLSEVEMTRRHFVELQRQIAAARATQSARAAERGRVERLRAQARAASGSQRDAFEAEAAALEGRLGWGDRAAVLASVRSAPMVTLVRTTPTLDGLVPVSSANGRGCVQCHVAVATRGYEDYPAPLRTHPQTASYVGAESPHPPSRVACVSCHLGNGQATTFAGAAHATLDDEKPSVSGHEWADVNADASMLPVGRTEAGCVSCHAGELYQPGATVLNQALVTVERAGCYACHEVPGLQFTAKRGPDLRRIGAKLTEAWVRTWLANPRAVKPATWMPRFWPGDASSPDDAAAVDAVTAYLFANAEPYVPATSSPPRGDAGRGKALVEGVGCLGCHILGNEPREGAGVRRSFGQPLGGVGSKTTYAWLFDWVREPTRFSPDTRMPNLRLDAREAADVATFLAASTRELPAAPNVASADDRYRGVVQRYTGPAGRDADEAGRLTGEALRVMAGRTVIDALGCFNCHEIRGFEDRRRAAPIGRRAVWRDADALRIHTTPAAGSAPSTSTGPDAELGPTEATRLALALTAIAGRARDAYGLGMPWQVVKAVGRTLVQQRNCVGCHPIEGVGGDFVQLVGDTSLGPPLLTPEGSRVQPAWLRDFLQAPRTIRPWLTVRMPTFHLSADEIDRTGAYFRAIAVPNPEPPSPAQVPPAEAGQELFDLLKCQQCHVLGTIPRDQPTENLAPDLRLARERLQPEWILAWLRNPSAILPGTRMPTFWPDYPKSFYEPLGGDGAAQVRAIRDHVLMLR